MKAYDYIYAIKDNVNSDKIFETAVNQGIDGSLVLLVIEGKNIRVRDIVFNENVRVCVENTADAVLFQGCSFECTDIMLENRGTRVLFNNCTFRGREIFTKNWGFQVFNECRFLCSAKESILVSCDNEEEIIGKLIYTVIKDSEILFENNESMAFITDGDMKASVINTRITGDNNVVIWTREMTNSNTFSYYGSDYIFGSQECGYEIPKEGIQAFSLWNMLSGSDNWNPVNAGDKYKEHEKEVFYITARSNITMTAGSEKKIIEAAFYPKEAKIDYACKFDSFIKLAEKNIEGNIVYLEAEGENDSEDSIYGFITIESSKGIRAGCMAEIKPSMIEPPKFLSTPVITIKDGRAYINYDIDLQGREDQSEISWYRVDNIDRTKLVAIREFTRSNERDCRKIAVSRQGPCRDIVLTTFDVGKHIKVNIKPKHSRSVQGPGLNIMSRIIMASDIKTKNIVVNIKNQVLNPYYKEEPGFGTPTGIWFYKKLKGCKHYSMVTESRECGYYLNGEEKHDNMTVYVILDFENNNGGGFSRKGEYVEIYIKYDSREKSGYGIRCECMDAEGKTAGFSLYKYDGLTVQPISDMITGPYMKSGMDIKLDIVGNSFTGEITVPGIKEIININANIDGNEYSGMGIKNNLAVLDSNRIGIRHIEISYPEHFEAD